MFRIFFLFFLISFNIYCQDVPIIKFHELEKIISEPKGEIRVINFWATWCAPCVKELPYFENINEPGVSVVLINLDFAEKLDLVKSFMARKNMKKKVLLLDEIDYNSWIEKVDKDWSGAIPATLIINSKTGKRKFISKELEEGQLEKVISELKG